MALGARNLQIAPPRVAFLYEYPNQSILPEGRQPISRGGKCDLSTPTSPYLHCGAMVFPCFDMEMFFAILPVCLSAQYLHNTKHRSCWSDDRNVELTRLGLGTHNFWNSFILVCRSNNWALAKEKHGQCLHHFAPVRSMRRDNNEISRRQ